MPFHYDKVLQERIWISDEEHEIINLPAFLRLKHIKQNGFSYVKYPDATNTRYDHSIGTLFWATKLYGSIFPNESLDVENNLELRALRIAALVHDIGHGPFSHALEELLFRNGKWFNIEPWKGLRESFGHRNPHELITLNYLSSRRFKETVENKDIRSKVYNILDKKEKLSLLISGDLDADRLDYLTRDSHYSGLPFGFNIKVIFNELLEQKLRIDSIDSNYFLTIDAEGLPALEQFLLARYAHYKYIAYEPTILLANLVFVSSIEEALEKHIKKKEDIAQIIFHLFKDLMDNELLHLNFSSIADEAIREKLELLEDDNNLRRTFENLESGFNSLKLFFVKLVNVGKNTAYNLLKKGKQFEIREVEKIFYKEFRKSIRLWPCLPSALTMNTCVFDNNVEPKYSPSLIYDYSPIVQGLEQKMYLDCGILIASEEAIEIDQIIEKFNKLVRRKTDFDIHTYAIVKYISRVYDIFNAKQSKWELRRTRLFEFLKFLNETLLKEGIITKLTKFDTPWYSIEMYDTLQKLEFLDVICEDFNIRHGKGFIPFYVYSQGEFAEDISKIIDLSHEDKEVIEKKIEEYIRSARLGRI